MNKQLILSRFSYVFCCLTYLFKPFTNLGISLYYTFILALTFINVNYSLIGCTLYIQLKHFPRYIKNETCAKLIQLATSSK